MRLRNLGVPWDLQHLQAAQTWPARSCLNSCRVPWIRGLALNTDGKTLKSLMNEKMNLGPVCQVLLFLYLFSLQVLLFPDC